MSSFWKKDETIKEDEKKSTLKYNKSNLIYDGNRGFYKYYNIKIIDNLSFKSKYSFLVDFFKDLDKFSRLKNKNKNTKEKEKLAWYSFRIT